MSIQYRHKTTGRLASLHGIQPEKLYDIEGQVKGYVIGTVPAWMIEDSCDWEKIEDKPKVILTTEDGVHITDREKYLPSVQTANWKERSMAAHQYLGVLSDYKIFSSEAKRDEYILQHKPLITLTDIFGTLTIALIKDRDKEKLMNLFRSLAKSKL